MAEREAEGRRGVWIQGLGEEGEAEGEGAVGMVIAFVWDVVGLGS